MTEGGAGKPPSRRARDGGYLREPDGEERVGPMIGVHVTATEKRLAQAQANRNGLSLSRWARKVLIVALTRE